MNTYDDCLAGVDSCYSCPSHRDCYTSCSEQQWGTWFEVEGSPYNNQAFCERFPRTPTDAAPPPEGWTYLAQTGKAEVARANFDTIYSSIITIFQILTGVLSQTALAYLRCARYHCCLQSQLVSGRCICYTI